MDVAAEIQTATVTIGSVPNFAVRALRVTEDVVNPRASGLEQAFLAVPSVALAENVRRCWATAWTSRAIYYRQLKKIQQDRVTIAVVVQPMPHVQAAGVMFTSNPLTGAHDEIQIDATWGSGEAIVAARWEADHFVLDKRTLSPRSVHVADKRVTQVAATSGGFDSRCACGTAGHA